MFEPITQETPKTYLWIKDFLKKIGAWKSLRDLFTIKQRGELLYAEGFKDHPEYRHPVQMNIIEYLNVLNKQNFELKFSTYDHQIYLWPLFIIFQHIPIKWIKDNIVFIINMFMRNLPFSRNKGSEILVEATKKKHKCSVP